MHAVGIYCSADQRAYCVLMPGEWTPGRRPFGSRGAFLGIPCAQMLFHCIAFIGTRYIMRKQ